MIYLVGWGGVYLALLINTLSGYRGRSFGFLSIFFFASIAVFRGRTGTDTATYETVLSGLSLETIWDGVEPGFAIVGLLFTEILGSAESGVRALSALFFILVAFFYIRADRNESFVLLAYLAPAYFYQYSMNAMRIGIASAILLLSLQAIRRSHYLKGSTTMLLAVIFHYTIVISIFFITLNFLKKINYRYLFLFGVIFMLLIYSTQEYIFFKLSIYSDFEKPNILSGLSKVLVVFVFIFGVPFSCLSPAIKIRFVTLAIAFVAFAIGSSLFSYAGLRFLDLAAFAIPLVVLMFHSEANRTFNWKTKLSFILAGFLSAASVYRGFLLEAGQGKSPFLPYELFNFF